MDRRWGIAFAVTLATLGIASGAQGKVLGGSSASVRRRRRRSRSTTTRRIVRLPAIARSGRRSPTRARATRSIVCAGTYAEGPGTPGSAALIIQKSLTLTGAGADLVTVEPKSIGDNPRIAGDDPTLRSYEGDIVCRARPGAIARSPSTSPASPSTRTASTRPRRRLQRRDRARSTARASPVSTSTRAPTATRRRAASAATSSAIGVAMVTRDAADAGGKPVPDPLRTVTIDHTRIDHYNAVGVLVDGSTDDFVAGVRRRPVDAVGRQHPRDPDERPDRRTQLLPELQRPDRSRRPASRTRR